MDSAAQEMPEQNGFPDLAAPDNLVAVARAYRGYSQDSTRALAALRDRFHSRLIETFLGLFEITRTNRPSLFTESGLGVAIERVFEDWPSFVDVARTPSFCFWTSIWRDLTDLNPGSCIARNDIDRVVSALGGTDREAFLMQHLRRFGALAACTALRAGTSFQLSQPVPLSRAWLPLVEREWLDSSGNAGPALLVGVEEGQVRWDDRRTAFHDVPIAEHGALRLHVHANAPEFQLRHVERWDRITDFAGCQQAAERLTAGIRRLADLMPEFLDHAALVAVTCVPLTSRATVAMASGSYTRLQGALFLLDSDDPDLSAEMLIHEVSHNKLSLLEDSADFFANFSRSRSAHYSPWRDERRSAEGVLHALFVHAEIARFWIRCHARPHAPDGQRRAARRVWTLLGQLQLGSDALKRTGDFTAVGRALLDAIDEDVESFIRSFPPCDAAELPFFSEIKQDARLADLPIAQALRAHYEAIVAKDSAKL